MEVEIPIIVVGGPLVAGILGFLGIVLVVMFLFWAVKAVASVIIGG